MTTLAQLLDERARSPEKRAAARTVTLPPTAFADTWGKKPTGDVVFGLRLIAEAEVKTAKAEAERLATGMHEDIGLQISAYDDALVRWCVARGLCDPNDVSKPHPLLPMAEDQVREALTPQGVQRLFDELERLQVDTSPLFPEATDDEVSELVDLLTAGALATSTRRVRRYLRFVLEELID